MNGRTKLAEWMNGFDPPVRQSDFCRHIGIDKSYLSRILGGKQRPGLTVAVQIESATLGRVVPADWVE